MNTDVEVTAGTVLNAHRAVRNKARERRKTIQVRLLSRLTFKKARRGVGSGVKYLRAVKRSRAIPFASREVLRDAGLPITAEAVRITDLPRLLQAIEQVPDHAWARVMSTPSMPVHGTCVMLVV